MVKKVFEPFKFYFNHRCDFKVNGRTWREAALTLNLHFWKQIIALKSRLPASNQEVTKVALFVNWREKYGDSSIHLVKVKVSKSLIAVGQWGLESHCILGTAEERRSPSLSFRCPILS